MSYYLPAAFVIMASVFYHVCSKSVPSQLNPMAGLFITYAISAVITLISFYLMPGNHNLIGQFKQINWTIIFLGITIVTLEFGNIMLYRAGWSISIASLVCNIAMAVILLVVGLLLFKEHISFQQIVGIALCLGGLVLINK